MDEEKVFVILLKAELLNNKIHDIHFKFHYHDVASIARYEQYETVTLIEEDFGFLNITQNINHTISQPLESTII